MKWKDLSLKERKQIYDSVRANNPDATYFDIKEQFDSIPEYEDGIMLQNTNPEYVKWKSTLAPNLNKEVYGYDLYGAFQSNAEQVLEDDGYYHLPSRDPNTNKILKYPSHPTFYLGLTEDIKAGYYPQSRNGRTYTIPAYEDGKAGYTPEERAWVARRTVELGMEGKPAPQDSLYTIVDRAKVQNKPKKYDPTDSAIEQGKQVLSGLNKTVGTALTGASLATMGLWNAARLLNVGTGSSWRLWAAKNALTGANAGLAADVGSFIEDPSITNAVQVGLSKVGSKDLTTTSNKIVNTISSGFDFDDLTKVPAYQDGKGKTINKADLPPEYRTGTPEYFERQRKISGAVNTVQPEAYITPAGYIKDAVNFIEDLGKGDYAGAAIDAALNLIPWGVGKGIKKLKSKVGRIIEGTEVDGVSVHSFAPTQTKKKTKKKTEEDYDSEFSEVLRKDRNSKKYQQEISRTIEQAIFPDERTRELVENVDKTYGTNYKRAYSNIAYKDMTKRGSYVKWGNTDKDGYGQINIKNIKDNVLPTDINDYNIVLDNNIYMPGTANHELGHVADGLAGSRKIQDFDSGKEYITNTYLNYLANPNNAYSSAELRKMGLFDAAGSRSYLLNPTEAKSHMLTLKRSLKDSGKITNWSTPVDEKMILEYMRNPTSNKMVKNQYDLYRNKNEYIDRLNKLIPMEILMPLGGAGFIGNELNKE